MDEVLVLLGRDAPVTARQLAAREPLKRSGTQVFGEQVLVAHLSVSQRELVAAMPGVAGVFESVVPVVVALPEDLTGRLALEAWNARRGVGATGKQRIGEGAAWDDPRFEREGQLGRDGD